MGLVQASVTGGVGTVTLNDPPKRNALSAALIRDLLQALGDTSSGGARVIVVRAASGARVWSAGHDVNELPRNGRDPLTYDDPLRQVVRTIKELPVPVVAMIEGGVWGGACELVMSCDLVIAGEAATFAVTPAKLGVPYDVAGALNFMQAVPLQVIKELLFTARPIGARRALEVGMVNHVVPGDRLEATTSDLAEDVARNSPLVVRLLKEASRLLSGATSLTPEAFQRIQALRRRIYDSADYQEGIRAFFEKRAPRFQGR